MMCYPEKQNIDSRRHFYRTKINTLSRNLAKIGVKLDLHYPPNHPHLRRALRMSDPFKYLMKMCKSHQTPTNTRYYCIICDHLHYA